MGFTNGKKYMDVITYSGTGSVQSIGGLEFSPDFVWIKDRDAINWHHLVDTVRGADKYIFANETDQETTSADRLTSFDSNGFSLGANTNTNTSSNEYVAWCWDAGDTTVTNTEGSVSAQVRSNGTFSIATFDSPATAAENNWGHGLNAAPSFVITKSAGGADNWHVYHKDITNNGVLFLNTPDAALTGNSYWDVSDAIIGTPSLWDGAPGNLRVSYQWTESPTQTFGSYAGNNGNNFVYTGFKPRWIMIKCSSNSADWTIYDTERDSGVLKTYLEPNNTGADSNAGSDGVSDGVRAVSNGFQIFGDFANINNSGYTYIYAVFGEESFATDPAEEELTLASSKDFVNLFVGSEVQQGDKVGTITAKDPASNTITVDSTGFQTGSAVSSTVDGTGEVVSVNPSLNRMTLKNVTGGFASGVGKNVDGSIRRLPKYQSETAVLTGVSNADPDYLIDNSLRFDSGNQSNLTRTNSVAGNRRKWTYSFWTKLSNSNTTFYQSFLLSGTGNMRINNPAASKTFYASLGSGSTFTSDRSFDDSSDWMHFVMVWDSDNSTESNRFKVYVDGEQITGTLTCPQGTDSYYNTADFVNIGYYNTNTALDCYLADVQFIDGQALNANAFGKFNPFGQWIAKDYLDPQLVGTITSTVGDTQLTVDSNSNFGILEVGSSIKQDSGYTPETSAITDAVNVVYVDGTTSDNTGSGTIYDIFDGSTSSYITVRMSGSNINFTNLPTAQSQMAYWMSYTGYAGSEPRIFFYHNNGSGEQSRFSLLVGTQTNTITRFEVPAPDPAWGPLVRINFDNAGSSDPGRLAAIEIDGSILQGATTTLTLTDDTDIANFRAGDAVDKGTVFSITPASNQMTMSPLSGDWTSASGTASTYWQSVTYGDDKFVAVSNVGPDHVMYSTDGISWTSASAAEDTSWISVTYGDGKFVAVSYGGTNRAMYSTDGINWTSGVGADTTNAWRSVTYGNGKFVAVSTNTSGQDVMHSTDGINWTRATEAATYDWLSVTYGDGKFVAITSTSASDQVMYSTDGGLTWTSANSAEPNSWRDITYGDGKFVAVASNGTNQVMYSTDGINWTAASAIVNTNWWAVTYGDGTFVAVSESGLVMYSTDAINWTSGSAAETNDWQSVTYGDDKFVAVSQTGTNRVMWSYTGGPTVTYEVGETVIGPALSPGVGEVTSINTPTSTINYTLNTGRFISGQSKTVSKVNPHGTNGFHLPFESSDIGNDVAMGNDFTPNNITSADVVVDSPTDYGTDTGLGGEVRSNYCTFNPLATQTSGTITLSDGNLKATVGATRTTTFGTIPLTGKMYFEVVYNSGAYVVGMASGNMFATTANASPNRFTGDNATSWGLGNDGTVYNGGSAMGSESGYSDGDVIGWAYDSTTGGISMFVNGVANGTYTADSSIEYFPAVSLNIDGSNAVINCGQRPFAYPAPAGYETISTINI